MPDQLLSYWQEEGWCSYANGLFWTVDPDEYEDPFNKWLGNTKLEQLDAFHLLRGRFKTTEFDADLFFRALNDAHYCNEELAQVGDHVTHLLIT